MTTMERQATSGLALAATLLVIPASADASPRLVYATTPRTNTSASPDRIIPTSVSYEIFRGSASGSAPAAIEMAPKAFITTADELVRPPKGVIVTSLAEVRSVGQEAALLSLYRRISAIVTERGFRVARLVLAGEDLVDSTSDDLVLEIYVEGLTNDDARLDLWEVLSTEVEYSVTSPILLARLALVVHGESA